MGKYPHRIGKYPTKLVTPSYFVSRGGFGYTSGLLLRAVNAGRQLWVAYFYRIPLLASVEATRAVRGREALGLPGLRRVYELEKKRHRLTGRETHSR